MSIWNSPSYANAFKDMSEQYTADVILQTSGPNNYFVKTTRKEDFKPNQFIGEEMLLAMQMAGFKVMIVDWQNQLQRKINF